MHLAQVRTAFILIVRHWVCYKCAAPVNDAQQRHDQVWQVQQGCELCVCSTLRARAWHIQPQGATPWIRGISSSRLIGVSGMVCARQFTTRTHPSLVLGLQDLAQPSEGGFSFSLAPRV